MCWFSSPLVASNFWLLGSLPNSLVDTHSHPHSYRLPNPSIEFPPLPDFHRWKSVRCPDRNPLGYPDAWAQTLVLITQEDTQHVVGTKLGHSEGAKFSTFFRAWERQSVRFNPKYEKRGITESVLYGAAKTLFPPLDGDIHRSSCALVVTSIAEQAKQRGSKGKKRGEHFVTLHTGNPTVRKAAASSGCQWWRA